MMAVIAVSGLFQTAAFGSDGTQQGRPDRRGPPPEAIDACKEKSEGAAVEITTPHGDTIKATCKKIKGQLVAVPEGGPPGPGNGEPPEGGKNGQ